MMYRCTADVMDNLFSVLSDMEDSFANVTRLFWKGQEKGSKTCLAEAIGNIKKKESERKVLLTWKMPKLQKNSSINN